MGLLVGEFGQLGLLPLFGRVSGALASGEEMVDGMCEWSEMLAWSYEQRIHGWWDGGVKSTYTRRVRRVRPVILEKEQ